jgi:hypothetical protein
MRNYGPGYENFMGEEGTESSAYLYTFLNLTQDESKAWASHSGCFTYVKMVLHTPLERWRSWVSKFLPLSGIEFPVVWTLTSYEAGG